MTTATSANADEPMPARYRITRARGETGEAA